MTRGTRMAVVLFTLGGPLAGCGDSSPSAPSAPSQTALPTTATPVVFTELGSGFSTSDLRDVDEQILQVNTAGEVVWTTDGTRISGYRVERHILDGVALHWISGAVCPEGCAFEVRFGTKDGERRAYLTADYGHENPGTLVDVDVVGGALVVKRSSVFPPGTPTLRGFVSEVTPSGDAPVEGVTVLIGISSGWRVAITDTNGFYNIPGLFDVRGPVRASREDYLTLNTSVSISGDTGLNMSLVRR